MYLQPYTYEISTSLLFNTDTINMGNKRKKHLLTTFFLLKFAWKFSDNFVKSDFVFKKSYFPFFFILILL